MKFRNLVSGFVSAAVLGSFLIGAASAKADEYDRRKGVSNLYYSCDWGADDVTISACIDGIVMGPLADNGKVIHEACSAVTELKAKLSCQHTGLNFIRDNDGETARLEPQRNAYLYGLLQATCTDSALTWSGRSNCFQKGVIALPYSRQVQALQAACEAEGKGNYSTFIFRKNYELVRLGPLAASQCYEKGLDFLRRNPEPETGVVQAYAQHGGEMLLQACAAIDRGEERYRERAAAYRGFCLKSGILALESWGPGDMNMKPEVLTPFIDGCTPPKSAGKVGPFEMKEQDGVFGQCLYTSLTGYEASWLLYNYWGQKPDPAAKAATQTAKSGADETAGTTLERMVRAGGAH